MFWIQYLNESKSEEITCIEINGSYLQHLTWNAVPKYTTVEVIIA